MAELNLMVLLTVLYGADISQDAGNRTLRHHDWSYHGNTGPERWPTMYPHCGGTWQSPVNIPSSRVEYTNVLQNFRFRGFRKASTGGRNSIFKIRNNGHTASMGIDRGVYTSGGNLTGSYKAAEVHFHWGSSNTHGSEHGFDNSKFPLEMHIVHYAVRYGNLSQAMLRPDGLMVIAIFGELSDVDHPGFQRVALALESIVSYNQRAAVIGLKLLDLLPKDTSKYYYYPGSLTTPPCYESVLWMVMADRIRISHKQIWRLRRLLQKPENTTTVSSDHRIVDNFRPYQNLRNRVIYCSHSSLAGDPRRQPGSLSPNGLRSLGVPPADSGTGFRRVQGVASVQVQEVQRNNVTGETRVRNSRPVPVARFSGVQRVNVSDNSPTVRVSGTQQQTVLTSRNSRGQTSQSFFDSQRTEAKIGADQTRITHSQQGTRVIPQQFSPTDRANNVESRTNTGRMRTRPDGSPFRTNNDRTNMIGSNPAETKALMLPSQGIVPDYSIHVVPGHQRIRLHIPIHEKHGIVNGESEVSAIEVHPKKGLFKITLQNQKKARKKMLYSNLRQENAAQSPNRFVNENQQFVSKWRAGSGSNNARKSTTKDNVKPQKSSVTTSSKSSTFNQKLDFGSSHLQPHLSPPLPSNIANRRIQPKAFVVESTVSPLMGNHESVFGKSLWFVTPFGEPIYDLHRIVRRPAQAELFQHQPLGGHSTLTTVLPTQSTFEGFFSDAGLRNKHLFQGRNMLNAKNMELRQSSALFGRRSNNMMSLFPFFESPVRIQRPYDAALRLALSNIQSSSLSNSRDSWFQESPGFTMGIGNFQK